jgi:hypothetical protein
MANNVAVTAGAGTTMATDDVAGVHYPVVKLATGTEDSAARMGHLEDAAHVSGDAGLMLLAVRSDTAASTSGTDGDYTALITNSAGKLHTLSEITGTPTVLINDTDAVEVRGNTTILRPTLTVEATPDYSIGDVIGGGEITLTSLTRTTGGGAVVQSVALWCDDALSPELDIMFFDADLAGGTYTENGALTLSAADKANWLGNVKIETTDWETIAGDTWATVYPGLVLKGDGVSDLRMIIVTQTALNLSGTGVRTMTLGLLRD